MSLWQKVNKFIFSSVLFLFLHASEHSFAVTAEIYRTLRMSSENELITNDSGNIMYVYSQLHADNV